MTNRQRLPIALIAALLLTATLVAPAAADRSHRHGQSHADAERIRQLEASLAQAQSDLVYYQQAYAALEDGLTKVEATAYDNRKNALRRIIKIVSNTRSKAANFVVPTSPSATAPAPATYGTASPFPAYSDQFDAYGNPINGNGYGYGYGHQGWVPTQTYQTVQPLGHSAYEQLLTSMNNAIDSRRLEIMRAVTPTTAFSVDQILGLMALCSFDSTRIELAALAYPNALDSRSWYRVYDGLTFSASRTTLKQRLGH